MKSLLNFVKGNLFTPSQFSLKFVSQGSPNPNCFQFFPDDENAFLDKGHLIVVDKKNIGEDVVAKEVFEVLKDGEVKKLIYTPWSVNLLLKNEELWTEENKKKFYSVFEKHFSSEETYKKFKELNKTTGLTPTDRKLLNKYIEEFLDVFVRPVLVSHGGQLEFKMIKDNTAYVNLKGMCSGCSSKGSTINNLIRSVLTNFFPEIHFVEEYDTALDI